MDTSLLQSASRYATPEVFTVAGTLVAGLVTWKALTWAVRTTKAAVGSILGAAGGAALTLSGATVAGGASVGWGLAQLYAAPATPGMAVGAGAALLVVALSNALAEKW